MKNIEKIEKQVDIYIFTIVEYNINHVLAI